MSNNIYVSSPLSENMKDAVISSESSDNASTIGFLKGGLSFLAQTSFLITILGFIVIQTHLAKTTGFFTYNINPVQYIGAGIALIGWLIIQLLPPTACIAVFVFLIVGVFALVIRRYRPLHDIVTAFANTPFWKCVTAIAKCTVVWMPRLYLVLLVLAALIGGIVFSSSYGNIPRAIGGGQPSDVILIFNTDMTNSEFPLQITGSRSGVVKLYAELTDGLLVWDETCQVAVKVNNNLLAGVISVPEGSNLFTPSPTPLPSGTAKPPQLSSCSVTSAAATTH